MRADPATIVPAEEPSGEGGPAGDGDARTTRTPDAPLPRNPKAWTALAGVLLLLTVLQGFLGFGILQGRGWTNAHVAVGLVMWLVVLANFYLALRPRLKGRAEREWRGDLAHAPPDVRRRMGME